MATLLVLSACTQRVTCPAFQSAYIYDKDELRKKFSYFLEDSTPKIYTASKTRYLIAEPVSYKKKLRQMRTLEMKPINPVVPDSLRPDFDPNLGKDGEDGVSVGDEFDRAARSVVDSVYIVDVPAREEAAPAEDSVYMISRDREVRVLKYNTPDSLKFDPSTGRYVPEKPSYVVVHVTFNVDQDNYMWYLRDYLVLPDVRLAANKGKSQGDGGSGKKAKKKEGGFFKNLFGKKKKDQLVEDEEQPAPPPRNENEDFDFIEDEEQVEKKDTAAPVQQEKKKKGLFGRDKSPNEKPKKAPKQEEDEEDEESPTAPAEDKDEGIDDF